MSVRLILKDGTMTAILDGEIDHHTAREIRMEIDETAGKMKPKRLILDFSGVQFMDSSGIGLIMGRYKMMQTINGSVTICNMSPKIEKIISLAGLDRLAKIERGVNNETNE